VPSCATVEPTRWRTRAACAAILDVLDDVAAERAQESSVVDVEAWAQELHDVVAGYGPLQRLFDDPEIEEIWVKCRLTIEFTAALRIASGSLCRCL